MKTLTKTKTMIIIVLTTLALLLITVCSIVCSKNVMTARADDETEYELNYGNVYYDPGGSGNEGNFCFNSDVPIDHTKWDKAAQGRTLAENFRKGWKVYVKGKNSNFDYSYNSQQGIAYIDAASSIRFEYEKTRGDIFYRAGVVNANNCDVKFYYDNSEILYKDMEKTSRNYISISDGYGGRSNISTEDDCLSTQSNFDGWRPDIIDVIYNKTLTPGKHTIKVYVQVCWVQYYELTWTIDFVVDTVAPTIKTNDGVTVNEYFNQSVKVSVSDANLDTFSYTYRPKGGTTSSSRSFDNGKTFSDDGYYVFTATDKAGHVTTRSFYLDTTAPALTRTAEYTKAASAQFTFSDLTPCSYTLTKNNTEYDKGNDLTSKTINLTDEGVYKLTVTDSVGGSNHTSTLTMTIDRTPPKVTMHVHNGKYNGTTEITQAISKGNSGPEGNVMAYSKSDRYVTYSADEKTEAPIDPDKTTLGFISTDGKTEYPATKDGIKYTTKLSSGQTPKKEWTTEDTVNNPDGTSYKKNTSHSEALNGEGRYAFNVYDKAGNITTCYIVFDKTPLTLSAYNNNGNSIYAKAQAVVTEKPDADKKAPLRSIEYVRNDDKTPTKLTYSEADGKWKATIPQQDGKYTVTATDEAGNSFSYVVYVDNVAPIVTIKANDASGWKKVQGNKVVGGVTDGAADNFVYSSYQNTASWTTPLATESPIDPDKTTCAYTDLSNSANNVGAVPYTNGSALYKTEPYEWKSAPDPYTGEYTTETRERKVAIHGDGKYTFTIYDKAGNFTVCHIFYDTQAPVISFTSNDVFSKYTNAPFTAIAKDAMAGVEGMTIKFEADEGNPTSYVGAFQSRDGLYTFTATDKVGNTSTAYAVKYTTATFGNYEAMRDKYKVTSWYTVSLPKMYFFDNSGTYSFDSYDKALAFAKNQEFAEQVTTTSTGYKYYDGHGKGDSNRQTYSDKQSVMQVVERYVTGQVPGYSGYISSRKVSSSSGSDYYYTENESLTRNAPELPTYLNDYKNLPRIYARAASMWSKPSVKFLRGKDYVFTVSEAFLGDGASESALIAKDVPLDTKFSTVISDPSAPDIRPRQGWYLITESDVAGNVQRYLIYVDIEQPCLNVTAAKGDKPATFTYDKSYSENETLYFTSFAINGAKDNADDNVVVKVEWGRQSRLFVPGDKLPVFGTEEYPAGKYTLTVYDRSKNAFSSIIYIAGDAPKMTHGSLESDTQSCNVSFRTTDNYCNVNYLSIYKIEYDGKQTPITELATNAEGTETTVVSFLTLNYYLTVGGRYGAVIKDNFGRTTVCPSFFYRKGLPEVKLGGVKEDGITKNNVSITFDSVNVCELYTLLPGGDRVPFDNFATQQNSASTAYVIGANAETSKEFCVYIRTADPSLYNEYYFSIDAVPPTVTALTTSGEVIQPGDATNKPFTLSWDEPDVTVKYAKTENTAYGTTYSLGDTLIKPQLYYFTAKDKIGNEYSFSILLDNAVDFTLTRTDDNGKEKEIESVDGVYYSTTPVTFTVNEQTSSYSMTNGVFSVENGETVAREGKYFAKAADKYGNTISLVIIYDCTPPQLTMSGVNEQNVSNTAVTVVASDYNSFYVGNERGAIISDITESATTITDEGEYFIYAQDKAGNKASLHFTVDKSVSFTLSVANGAITTEPVTLKTSEALTLVAKRNGEEIEGDAKRFTDAGRYDVTLTDSVGNASSCSFVIVPSLARELKCDLPNGTELVSVLKDGAPLDISDAKTLNLTESGEYVVTLKERDKTSDFTVTVDATPPQVTFKSDNGKVSINKVSKDRCTFTATKDGKEIDFSRSTALSDPGMYTLTVTDELGNSKTYTFTLKYRPNTWAIVAIVVGVILLIVLLVIFIRSRIKRKVA